MIQIGTYKTWPGNWQDWSLRDQLIEINGGLKGGQWRGGHWTWGRVNWQNRTTSWQQEPACVILCIARSHVQNPASREIIIGEKVSVCLLWDMLGSKSHQGVRCAANKWRPRKKPGPKEECGGHIHKHSSWSPGNIQVLQGRIHRERKGQLQECFLVGIRKCKGREVQESRRPLQCQRDTQDRDRFKEGVAKSVAEKSGRKNWISSGCHWWHLRKQYQKSSGSEKHVWWPGSEKTLSIGGGKWGFLCRVRGGEVEPGKMCPYKRQGTRSGDGGFHGHWTSQHVAEHGEMGLHTSVCEVARLFHWVITYFSLIGI